MLEVIDLQCVLPVLIVVELFCRLHRKVPSTVALHMQIFNQMNIHRRGCYLSHQRIFRFRRVDVRFLAHNEDDKLQLLILTIMLFA